MVDIEADGPIPGDYSMISIGAVAITKRLETFYVKIRPISCKYKLECLKISGFSREETLLFEYPEKVMEDFLIWLENLKTKENYGSPIFISDNNGFDWQFVNWYFWHFLGKNPFGHSSVNLSSFYKGLNKNVQANFKRFKKKHSHDALDDAMGNVEAFLKIINKYDIKHINQQ